MNKQFLTLTLIFTAVILQNLQAMQPFPERKCMAATEAAEGQAPAQAQSRALTRSSGDAEHKESAELKKTLDIYKKLPSDMQEMVLAKYHVNTQMLDSWFYEDAQAKKNLLHRFVSSPKGKHLAITEYTPHSIAGFWHQAVTKLYLLKDGETHLKIIFKNCGTPVFSSDGKFLALSKYTQSGFNNEIQIWDLQRKGKLSDLFVCKHIIPLRNEFPVAIKYLQFNNDNKALYILVEDLQGFCYLDTLTISSNTRTTTLIHEDDFFSDRVLYGMSTDGRILCFTNTPENDAYSDFSLYNPHSRTFTKLACTDQFPVTCVALSNAGDRLIVGAADEFSIWDTTTQKIIHTEKLPLYLDDSNSDNCTEVALSADNTHAIFGFRGGKILCKRISLETQNVPSKNFNSKLLPFVDWLYTTQKERNFKPLTLTQAGFKLFKQLDEFSQTALMRNLNLRKPAAQATTQVESKAAAETKATAAAKAQEQSSCTIM